MVSGVDAAQATVWTPDAEIVMPFGVMTVLRDSSAEVKVAKSASHATRTGVAVPNVTVKVPPEAVHTKDWISRTYPSWLPAYVPQLPPVYPGKQVQRPIVWSQMPRFEQSTWHLLPLAPVP